MKNRIVGFDLARAYAIFGMFIVNFNIVFGSYKDTSLLGQFLSLFNGNSSSTFVILAGMGVALMTNRAEYTRDERLRLKSIVMRRSWFLFVTGLLLYNWWPADILHFYGGYMHIAALLLFVPKRLFLLAAVISILAFHLLLVVVPYETGWNFETLQYLDFWTIPGFLRNTFYNGWNPIFPWAAYFMLGMWLGRLDWQDKRVRKNILLTGIIGFAAIEILQLIISRGDFDEGLKFYVMADYIPPFLPFMIGTASFALVLLVACIAIGERISEYGISKALTATGQMTLTHYIAHLTIGMVILALLSGKTEIDSMNNEMPLPPIVILLFSVVYFSVSVIFSNFWAGRFPNGPLETLMRKVSG